MEVKLMLTVCIGIVRLGITYGQPPIPTVDQFQNLFDSIAKKNTKKSEIYHENLEKEVAKERQAFDAMKQEMIMARVENTYRKRNFWKQSNTNENIVARKRETSEFETTTTTTTTTASPDKMEVTLHFITIVKIEEAPSYVRQPGADSQVCRYSELQRLEICKEALQEGFIKRQYKLSKTADMGRETVYRIKYGGILSSNSDEETVSACKCPTWPPIYLQDGLEPGQIKILVQIIQRIQRVDVDTNVSPNNLEEAGKIISALKRDLNETLMKCTFYKIVIGIRPVIQQLEDELYPFEALSRVENRYYRWLIILLACQKNPRVQQMLDSIASHDGPKFDARDFAEEAQKLFPDDTTALQSIGFPNSCFEPDALEHVLKTEGKKLKRQEQVVISVLINAKHSAASQKTSVADDSTGPEDYVDLKFRCIRIKGDFDFRNHEEADKEIRHFFKDTDTTPVIEQIQDMKSEWGAGNYKVEFYYLNYAIQALYEVGYRTQISASTLLSTDVPWDITLPVVNPECKHVQKFGYFFKKTIKIKLGSAWFSNKTCELFYCNTNEDLETYTCYNLEDMIVPPTSTSDEVIKWRQLCHDHNCLK